MMKAILFIAMTLVLASAASALPFGTKSADGATEKQEIASVRGAVKEVSRSQTPEASAVVESFFESSSADSGSLQETLHAMANAEGSECPRLCMCLSAHCSTQSSKRFSERLPTEQSKELTPSPGDHVRTTLHKQHHCWHS